MATVANTTVGELSRAEIFQVDDQKEKINNGLSVPCLFNPFEYTLQKSNNYSEPAATKGKDVPKAEYSGPSPQTLQLNLTFDSYEEGKDVQEQTNKLWEMMKVPKDGGTQGQEKPSPLPVAFAWGTFYFVAYITSMNQKFTHFTHQGIPVRAKVDITFTQYVDEDDYRPKGSEVGSGILKKIAQVKGGDRLDTIAAAVLGDATRWREIAKANSIVNPLSLIAGAQLKIPFQ